METLSLKQYANKIPEIISYISIALYIIWGISIVREDFETGKIKNSKIILGFKIISALILINVINTIAGYSNIATNYMNVLFYKNYILHCFYSVIFSYILWYGEIWPAGDSKFYIANLCFIPLINYNAKGFPSYLWISVLINIFILSAFFSVFRYVKDNISMVNTGDKDAFKELKNFYLNKIKKINFKSPVILITLFNVISIFVYKQMLNLMLQEYVFNIFKRTDIFFFLMFFLWPKISQFLKSRLWKYIMIFMYSVFILSIILNPHPIDFLANVITVAFKNTLKFGGIFFIGKILFEQIIEIHNTYYASKEEIKPGMVLSSKELEVFRNNEVFEGIFEDAFKDGLDEEQVEKLKDWLSKHPDKNAKIEFVKSKPFALGIFTGCVMEIVFDANIVSLLK
ncbi:MAG TPA: hypothetical protein PLD81_00360 [Elusimicrobiales bacterium]|nr:hypothetical protein [Elusimicrobiales bacterium]